MLATFLPLVRSIIYYILLQNATLYITYQATENNIHISVYQVASISVLQ